WVASIQIRESHGKDRGWRLSAHGALPRVPVPRDIDAIDAGGRLASEVEGIRKAPLMIRAGIDELGARTERNRNIEKVTRGLGCVTHQPSAGDGGKEGAKEVEVASLERERQQGEDQDEAKMAIEQA